MTFSLVSFISGIIALFSSKVRLRIRSKPMRIFHIAFGMIALSMGLITMIMGFHMPYFRASREGLSTAIIAFVVMTLFYILVQPVLDILQMVKNM